MVDTVHRRELARGRQAMGGQRRRILGARQLVGPVELEQRRSMRARVRISMELDEAVD